MNSRSFECGLIAALICLAVAAAMPAVAQPAAPAFYKINLKESISPKVRAGGFQGRADRTGHRLVAENLSIVQPVTIVVLASDVKKPVRVDLVKGSWDDPLRSGQTDTSGRLEFRTRTEGNMGILVRSTGTEPAPYVIAMWVGPEMPSRPKTIFKAKGRQ